VLVVLVLLSFGYAASEGCEQNDSIAGAGERFLAALRSGDLDGAYAQLSTKRRAAMSFADFSALVGHPAFLRHEAVSFGRPESRADGKCTLGTLTVDGDDWGVQLFYVEEGDTYRVHSFGLQGPALMQLGELLEECGYWEGTTAGYSGPPVERVSPPTAL
jgi:hypothetical protein